MSIKTIMDLPLITREDFLYMAQVVRGHFIKKAMVTPTKAAYVSGVRGPNKYEVMNDCAKNLEALNKEAVAAGHGTLFAAEEEIKLPTLKSK
jgi:hypothetical protein